MFLTIRFSRQLIQHKAYYMEYNNMTVLTFICNLTKWYIQKKVNCYYILLVPESSQTN